MNNNQLWQLNHQFLTDKEWWMEKTDKEYILFVKHNGKTYRSSYEKKRVDFFKSEDTFMLKSQAIILISKIKLQIAEDKIKQLKYE